jgi:uncharacterized cupin superfamily protein
MTIPTRLTAGDLLGAPLTPGRLSRLAFETADIELRHYAPRGEDKQVPHDRDELYFVISGRGTFVRGAERVPFVAGDVLYAAAGEVHRFEGFSEDFATWVLFYGAKRTA